MQISPKLQRSMYFCFAPSCTTLQGPVEARPYQRTHPWKIRPIDERIKELCKKALTADDSEVKTLLEELQALLAEHSKAARYLAAKTLNRLDKAS
jgi:hypothetical protein